MAGENLATPVFQGTHKGVFGPAGVKPFFQYKNDSGQFTLNGPTGNAIYKFIDGNFFSDNLAFLGHKRVGQPDDDFSMIGFDSGFLYKVVNESFYFLFSDLGFPHPTLGFTVFRLYTSEDGVNFNRWKTNSGTQRVAIPRPFRPLSRRSTRTSSTRARWIKRRTSLWNSSRTFRSATRVA